MTYNTRVSLDAPGVTTLPAVFKQNGYVTVSNGKVYHEADDDLEAWSEPPWRPDLGTRHASWWTSEEQRAIYVRGGTKGPAFGTALQPESFYPDAQISTRTIEDLRRLSQQDKPFFLACGFVKPHLPFVAPQPYWDLYPTEQIELPDNMFFPVGLSKAFEYPWGELRQYQDIPKQGPLADEAAVSMIRGYYACVSFVDEQVGRVIDELDRLGLTENTIIVFWSDHGFQLGEHGFWCKHTDFEVATRVPLIVVAPNVEGGRSTTRLVEYVDLYPTLCEMADVPKPDHLQGRSFVSLLSDPEARHKDAIFTRHWKSDAIRTERYRYMETRADGGRGELRGVGLFDLENDPGENRNVANDPDYRMVLSRLQARLTAHRDRYHTALGDSALEAFAPSIDRANTTD